MTPDWQDISSAPKDGTRILVAGHEIEVASWSRAADVWEIYDGMSVTYPTHWMPLPDPPVQEPSDVE